MFDLSGRVVVVTGGNGGIGLGMGRALATAGASISVWGRNPTKNEAAVAELRDIGARAESLVVDVADETSVDDAMSATIGSFGRIDSMIANAGVSGGGPFLDQTIEQWRSVVAVNLDGVFLSFRAAARQLVDQGEGGSLVAVSSTSAIHGPAANQAYGSSKAGVLSLVRGLAVELARHQIRVNSLMPGWTETELTGPLLSWAKFMENTTKRTPVRRWGVPDDFGAAAVYLVEPSLMFHTGDCLVIDGGYTIF